MTTLGPMLLFRLRTIWKTVDGKFYPTRLIAQTLPLWLPFVPVDAVRPHWNIVHIRTGYQKLAWFILVRQAGTILLGRNPRIARKMGKSHSFRRAILWIILLYIFFLNKRPNLKKKNRTNWVIDPILLFLTLLIYCNRNMRKNIRFVSMWVIIILW